MVMFKGINVSIRFSAVNDGNQQPKLTREEKRDHRFLSKKRYPDYVMDLSRYQGKTVLDVGCGGGALISVLNKYGANAFGLDPSYRQGFEKHSFNQNKHLKKLLCADPKTLLAGDGTRLPIKDNSIDVVFSNHALFSFRTPIHEQFDDIDEEEIIARDQRSLSQRIPAIQEIERILKPDGKLYATPVSLQNFQQLLKDAKTDRLKITNYGKTPEYLDDRSNALIVPADHPPIDRNYWIEISKV